jgi:hypothetical protein
LLLYSGRRHLQAKFWQIGGKDTHRKHPHQTTPPSQLMVGTDWTMRSVNNIFCFCHGHQHFLRSKPKKWGQISRCSSLLKHGCNVVFFPAEGTLYSFIVFHQHIQLKLSKTEIMSEVPDLSVLWHELAQNDCHSKQKLETVLTQLTPWKSCIF